MNEKINEWKSKLEKEYDDLKSNEEFSEEITGRMRNIEALIEQIDVNKFLRGKYRG